MDSRDVKTIVDIPDDKLSSIYQLQKELIKHYVDIEGLPMYPININTKKNQSLIKDFTGRIAEELAEGYEALMLVKDITLKNQLWFNNVVELKPDNYQSMLNHLQNVGEEMADSLHFFIELLIYINVQPEDIVKWVTNRTLIKNNGDPLEYIMATGKLLINEEIGGINHNIHSVNLLKPINEEKFSLGDIDITYFKCGSMYNSDIYITYKEILWDITYHLNIGRNFLKNKPWKKSEVMTQETEFQQSIVVSFVILMGLLDIMGCTANDVYFLYFKKNEINQFRIKSNY